MAVLSSLTASEYATILLIHEYLEKYGKKAFTYRGLRKYWSIKKLYADPRNPAHEWHTVERVIRKLVERGFLDRKITRYKRKKYVIFYPTTLFDLVIQAREKVIRK